MGALAGGLALAEVGDAVVVAVAAALLGLLAARRAPGLGAVAAVLVVAGAAAGELRLDMIDAPAALVRDGQRVDLVGHLLTPPRPNAFGSTAEVRVAGGRLSGARLLLRAARWAPLPGSVRVGEELRVEGRLRTLRADDYAAHLRGRGVAAELLLDDSRATGRRRAGLAGVLDLMRGRAELAVAAGMPAGEGALLRGMVLGQDEAIDAAVREDFRDSGLAHLLRSAATARTLRWSREPLPRRPRPDRARRARAGRVQGPRTGGALDGSVSRPRRPHPVAVDHGVPRHRSKPGRP